MASPTGIEEALEQRPKELSQRTVASHFGRMMEYKEVIIADCFQECSLKSRLSIEVAPFFLDARHAKETREIMINSRNII